MLKEILKYDTQSKIGSVEFYDENSKIGSCGFKINKNDVYLATEEETMLLVNHEHRHQGFGQKLITRAIDTTLKYVQNRNEKAKIIREIATWNSKGKQIIEQAGFKEIKDNEDYDPGNSSITIYQKMVNIQD